jgi:outer membrane protein assembly factor BamD (BamD/ComL family)
VARAVARRRLVWAAGAALVLIVALGIGAWRIASRLPVEQARQFMTAPIELGAQPAAPAGAPVAPAEVERRFAEARRNFTDGNYVEAANGFAAVVAADPAGPHAGPSQWNLTRSRLRSGDGSGALTSLDGLLRHYADYLGTEAPDLHAGLQHMQAGDLAAAQASYEQMIENQPDSEFVPLAWALIARIHWTHGEPMATIRAFGQMFASVHDSVPAYTALAGQLDRYANGDQSVTQDFQDEAQTGPEGFRDIYQYLAARSLLERNEFDKTADALARLQREHPQGDFTHIVDLEQAWNLLRNNQPAEALVIFQRLEQTAPPADREAFDAFFDLRAELPFGIARCQLALGNYTEAAAAFERAMAADPEQMYAVEDRLGLAVAYERLGQPDKAAAILRDTIAKHPDEPKRWALEQQLTRIERQAHAAQ